MQLGAWRNAALLFASRTPKPSRVSSRASRRNTGVLHVPSRAELASEEVVGFELVVR
jgi:hypothetical protein